MFHCFIYFLKDEIVYIVITKIFFKWKTAVNQLISHRLQYHTIQRHITRPPFTRAMVARKSLRCVTRQNSGSSWQTSTLPVTNRLLNYPLVICLKYKKMYCMMCICLKQTNIHKRSLTETFVNTHSHAWIIEKHVKYEAHYFSKTIRTDWGKGRWDHWCIWHSRHGRCCW